MATFLIFINFLIQSSFICLRIGAIDDGTATVDEILADPVARIYSDSMVQLNPFRLTGFAITRYSDVGTTEQSGMAGGHNEIHLSDAQIELVKNCVPGDKIFIENIGVICPDGTKRKLSPITIKIVAP